MKDKTIHLGHELLKLLELYRFTLDEIHPVKY